MLLVDLIPKVGQKVVVCGGQPLTSRLTCLVLEGDDPGGQIKTPIIPVKKVQGGDNMPYFRPHTVEDLRRSWILDHTNIHPEMEKVIKIAELHFWPNKISTKKWPKNDPK